MSQLLAPTHTLADSIPLGRRINEIMLEKGSAYTISAMAKRLEINRETLRLMLKGEREIYTFELEKIAKDIHVPVERILQSDVVEDSRRIHEIMVKVPDPQEAKKIATRLVSVAIGYTERGITFNLLLNAHGWSWELDEVIKIYKKALPIAELIIDKFGDSTVFWYLTLNLSNAQHANKDYKGFEETLTMCKSYHTDDIRVLGVLTCQWARLFEFQYGDLEGAQEKYYQALSYSTQTGNPNSIGNMSYHVGNFEYRQGRHEKACELFTTTLKNLRDQVHHYSRLNFDRDYAKVLIRMQRTSEASEFLSESLQIYQTRYEQEPASKAQALLLLAIARQD
ncbi:MAG: tetratricopeptide repeat protein, partial [Tumebacillaceae bacterium]